MPNTPALLGAGMAAAAAGKRAGAAHLKWVLELFAAVGRSVEVAEEKMDLVTGLSGSGPAYVFHLIEGMVEAGVRGGLSEAVALELAAQTVYGAGRMALETGRSPADLRIQVTSPGGTTQAGLKVMEEKEFKQAVVAAVEAATQRGVELRKLSENS
jgi:pyrroline-5-carboxylate reductase